MWQCVILMGKLQWCDCRFYCPFSQLQVRRNCFPAIEQLWVINTVPIRLGHKSLMFNKKCRLCLARCCTTASINHSIYFYHKSVKVFKNTTPIPNYKVVVKTYVITDFLPHHLLTLMCFQGFKKNMMQNAKEDSWGFMLLFSTHWMWMGTRSCQAP